MKKIYFIIIIIGIIGISTTVIFLTRFPVSKNSKEAYKNNADSALSVIVSNTRTNSDGAVTVAVTPVDKTNWGFKIIMDTHSANLDEDLTQISVLADENGNYHKPIQWDGDPSGGHHRAGTLIFGKIAPAPKSVVLIIRQIGGIPERKFEWVL